MTFLALTHLRVRFRIEEARMRIERVQHAVNRTVDQPVRGQLVDVLTIDGVQRRREHAILLRHFVLPGERGAAKEPAGKRGNEDRKDSGRKKSGSAHSWIVTDQMPTLQRLPARAGVSRALTRS